MKNLGRALALAISGALAVASVATAAPAYDADSVIVKYRSGASASQVASLADRLGLGATLGDVRRLGASVVATSGDPAAVAARLERSALVAYAEPNYVLSVQAIPNDALFGQLYGLHNTGQTGGSADADIDAPEGWDAAGIGTFPGTGGAKVGIVDTGIQAAHQDLSGKVANCAQSRGVLIFAGSIREGSCADDNGHGTHVAGTIAARRTTASALPGSHSTRRLRSAEPWAGRSGPVPRLTWRTASPGRTTGARR